MLCIRHVGRDRVIYFVLMTIAEAVYFLTCYVRAAIGTCEKGEKKRSIRCAAIPTPSGYRGRSAVDIDIRGDGRCAVGNDTVTIIYVYTPFGKSVTP